MAKGTGYISLHQPAFALHRTFTVLFLLSMGWVQDMLVYNARVFPFKYTVFPFVVAIDSYAPMFFY
jgi:hypothetical protein